MVGADNAAAIAMYRRAGFTPAHTFEMHRGTESVLMAHRGAAPCGPTRPARVRDTRLVVSAAGALAAGVVLTPVAMVVARRTGVVDRPGPLKPQAAPGPVSRRGGRVRWPPWWGRRSAIPR